MSALRRTADAQGSLQEQFDRHKCEPEDTSQAPARVPADVLVRQGPNKEEDEEEDEGDGKKKDEDNGEDDDETDDAKATTF
jgi:hypothetical protein